LEIIVSDGLGNGATSEGVQTLNINDLTNFKGFDLITNSEVTEWVKTSMGASQVEAWKNFQQTIFFKVLLIQLLKF